MGAEDGRRGGDGDCKVRYLEERKVPFSEGVMEGKQGLQEGTRGLVLDTDLVIFST